MSQELKFTPGVRDLFLAEFRETGNLRLACEAAKISRSTVERYRREDPQFAEAYAEAEEDAADNLEEAARVRAVDGVLRRRYDKDGNCIAEETVYSDALLALLLKARRPAKFRENSKIELEAKVDATVDERKKASRIASILSLARSRRDNDDLG